MSLKNEPVARAHLLIRKPVAEVFGAFVDPHITSKFWFSRASGPLQSGETVTWYWDMYGVAAEVEVKELEPDRRILIAWPTPVEWIFEQRGDHTFVIIEAGGFTGSDDEKVARAMDSMGGFTSTLAACKAYLEHGIELALVADHNPDAHV